MKEKPLILSITPNILTAGVPKGRDNEKVLNVVLERKYKSCPND